MKEKLELTEIHKAWKERITNMENIILASGVTNSDGKSGNED